MRTTPLHPAICLVAIEPVSDFILLEQYAADRTAATWTPALGTALEGFPVKVVQGTSDEAKALCRHIAKDRGAQQVSGLFHGRQEICKGTGLCLARQVRAADAAVAAAETHLEAKRQPSELMTRSRPVPAPGPRPSQRASPRP